jgi:hypothetical protein
MVAIASEGRPGGGDASEAMPAIAAFVDVGGPPGPKVERKAMN